MAKKVNIKVISDANKLFTFAAKSIAKQLHLAIKKKHYATFAVAGGRSAETLFKKLCKQRVAWSKVHFFLIDERLVPISDDQSNFKILNDYLLKPLSKHIVKANVHPFIYNPMEEGEGAQHYNDEFAQCDGEFDVIFVSAGEDGHIAGLYPNHPLLEEKISGFATFHDSPKSPADRMTALADNFTGAQFSLLLIIGEKKRQALINLQNQRLNYKDCPAKLVTKSNTHLILTTLKKV